MLITKNLEREKNKVVKTFVETVTDAGLSKDLLLIKLPEDNKGVESFTIEDYKALVQKELNKPAFANVFTEEEKSEAIDMFAASLQRGVALKRMSDGFAEKMKDENYKAQANDLTEIDAFFQQDMYNSTNNDVQSKLAKAMKNIDIRTLPKDNILSLISNTSKGLSFFNSTIETNLKIQETELIIEDNKEYDASVTAAWKANDGVFDRFSSDVDNDELIQNYKNAVHLSKKCLDKIGKDFENTVFAEDLEQMDKDLKQIEHLQHFAGELVKDFGNPYETMRQVESYKSITTPDSPFFVPPVLKEYFKNAMLSKASAPAPKTAEETSALSNYLSKLNTTLRKHGYKGNSISAIPNPQKRTELYKIMEDDAKKKIATVEAKGLNEKAFSDKEGFLADLRNKKDKILDSDLYQKASSLNVAQEQQRLAADLKKKIEARNQAASFNQRVVDTSEKTRESLNNADMSFTVQDSNIQNEIAGLYDRLGDKSNFFHIDSMAFRNMKKALKKFKDAHDYMYSGDETDNNYDYYNRKDALFYTEEIVNALQEVHDNAAKYIEAKGKQTREKPSEMRISRLETAKEIEKVTGAYLKAYNTLVTNKNAVINIENSFEIAGKNIDFYKRHAGKIELPNVEGPKIPTIRRKAEPEKKAELVKQSENEPIAMGEMH